MVVSIANVSPTYASRYYSEGKTGVSTTPSSEWCGNSSNRLGLVQAVLPADFNQLLAGKSPTGLILVNKTRFHQQQLNAKALGEPAPTERAGIDLTTSAPKSVSLQALVFGDRLLELAHQQANREMLRVVEARYACTRITERGKRFKVPTGEVAIACFHHETSRALDPQLHTHNVILNLQRHPKTGHWQSLDNTEIYKAKMLLGQIYRNELACAAQDLGYSVYVTNRRHGLWELEGFTNKQLRAFSRRLNQIEEAVGVGASSKAQAWANRITRPSKVEYDRDELQCCWQRQARAMGLIALQPQPTQTEATEPVAIAQVRQWLSQWLGQRHTQSIDRRELERQALLQPGLLPFSTLQQTIDAYLSNPFIPLIGTSSYVFQRVQEVFSQTDSSTHSGSIQQPLSRKPHPQPSGQATTAIAAFREPSPSDRQFSSELACSPETNAARAYGTPGGKRSRTEHVNPEPCTSDERADAPIAADGSEVGEPPAGEQFDCRPQATPSEHGRTSTDAGGNGETSRLGTEFRALDELVAQVLERYERRTMVRAEDEARSDDSCPNRTEHGSPQETSDSGANYLAQSLETDDLELERER
ncbi:MAG: relaxase domain-containing protein [Trichocoleus desertorum ATA4-8-CV12]|jgi:conjugative relaxase-like TrwC/TraI family protein|nr:relaxase domain-containing protein [Trichocoleus desertorum ATA4-8-CV12]